MSDFLSGQSGNPRGDDRDELEVKVKEEGDDDDDVVDNDDDGYCVDDGDDIEEEKLSSLI